MQRGYVTRRAQGDMRGSPWPGEIDFVGGLGVRGDRNRRNQWGVGGMGERTGRGDWNWRHLGVTR